MSEVQPLHVPVELRPGLAQVNPDGFLHFLEITPHLPGGPPGRCVHQWLPVRRPKPDLRARGLGSERDLLKSGNDKPEQTSNPQQLYANPFLAVAARTTPAEAPPHTIIICLHALKSRQILYHNQGTHDGGGQLHRISRSRKQQAFWGGVN